MDIESYKLKSGYFLPILGLGTWNLKGERCRKAVKKAVQLGYRHIDTAEMYDNEEEVGKALRSIDRSKLFITSKVWRTNLGHDDLINSCEATLRKLGASYLDLYLIHWPNQKVSIKESLQAMGKLQEKDKVRSIGVSNFNEKLLEEALQAGEVPISVNQVEFHPYLYQESLLKYCKQNDVLLTAYSPLAKGRISQDETLREIGEKYGKLPAQVGLRWLVQKGIAVIPKSSSIKHLQENLDILDFELSKEDGKKIDSIKTHKRLVNPGFGFF